MHTCTRTCLKNVLPELVHHHVHSVITLQASDVVVNVFVEYRLNFLAEIVEVFFMPEATKSLLAYCVQFDGSGGKRNVQLVFC